MARRGNWNGWRPTYAQLSLQHEGVVVSCNTTINAWEVPRMDVHKNARTTPHSRALDRGAGGRRSVARRPASRGASECVRARCSKWVGAGGRGGAWPWRIARVGPITRRARSRRGLMVEIERLRAAPALDGPA